MNIRLFSQRVILAITDTDQHFMSLFNDNDISRPQTFYKYLTYGDWFYNFLAGKSIKFSSRSEFNDPLDCRAALKDKEFETAIIDYEMRLKIRGVPKETRSEKIKKYRESGSDRLKRFANYIDKILDKVGVLCVTEEWDNFLMWSHYADHHRGVCVGFKSDVDIFKTALKIKYEPDRPILVMPDALSNMEALYNANYLTKAKSWERELEWRILKKPLSEAERRYEEQYAKSKNMAPHDVKLFCDQHGAGYYEFCNSAIRDITLGAKIDPSVESDIRSFIQKLNLDVVVYKATLKEYEYAVIRE